MLREGKKYDYQYPVKEFPNGYVEKHECKEMVNYPDNPIKMNV